MLYVKYGKNRLHGFRGGVFWKGWRTDGRTDGQMTDACLYLKLTYEPSAQVSQIMETLWPLKFLTLWLLGLCPQTTTYINHFDVVFISLFTNASLCMIFSFEEALRYAYRGINSRKTFSHNNSLELNLQAFGWNFLYIYTVFERTTMALARLCGCAGWPEPSLVTYVTSTRFIWAGQYSEQVPVPPSVHLAHHALIYQSHQSSSGLKIPLSSQHLWNVSEDICSHFRLVLNTYIGPQNFSLPRRFVGGVWKMKTYLWKKAPEPLYNMVRYNMVLAIIRIRFGPQIAS